MKRARTAPKGAPDCEGLTVSLKRYPDTKLYADTKLLGFAVVLCFCFGGLFAGSLQLWAQTQQTSQQAWQQIPIPKLPAFHPAQPKRCLLYTSLRWKTLNAYASGLTKAFVEEDFLFNGKYMSGQQEMEPRWKRCVKSTDFRLGMALGQLYVDRTFGACLLYTSRCV